MSTLEVQTESLRWRFMKPSQLAKSPLYVSPLFSSTICRYRKERQKKKKKRKRKRGPLHEREKEEEGKTLEKRRKEDRLLD